MNFKVDSQNGIIFKIKNLDLKYLALQCHSPGKFNTEIKTYKHNKNINHIKCLLVYKICMQMLIVNFIN